MEFHSTCVLNFITFDMAYCLYPKATLIYQTTLVLKNPDFLVRKALSKYQRRGFTCRRLIGEQGSLFLSDSVRWVGDSQTWTLSLPPLPTFGYEVPYVSPAATTTWSIVTCTQDYHRIHFHLWADEPSVFPLIIATDNMNEEVGDAVFEARYELEETNRTVNGADR
ncbi:hypothetical protein BDY19DRAFT_998391 [Irpex rosettiformis]|uniref:Uncharacterized protein n=1 Tax=Irpex rosettiformis TaxID=378272 RepID=A0ACB8TNT8_9APHY|nr:hypothetical protein BDY19DRAFT_998391 [Irpex rosettiformis]